ncbi:MAG TPA: hypothetical protein VF083_04485 [Acidimicrobiia bacterium]
MVDAVLVEPDGLAATREPPRSGPGRGRVLAVAVGVVATGLFLIAGAYDRSDGEMPGRDLIQAYLDAWYGGDFDTAASLRAPERVRTGPSEDRARGEVQYQAILGARAELLGCEPLPPATVRCDVAYSNALNQAAGAAPAVVAQQFGIRDGLLLFVAGPYLEDEMLRASFGDFAAGHIPDEYEDACAQEPNYQPPSCAELKLRYLEKWADWRRLEAG